MDDAASSCPINASISNADAEVNGLFLLLPNRTPATAKLAAVCNNLRRSFGWRLRCNTVSSCDNDDDSFCVGFEIMFAWFGCDVERASMDCFCIKQTTAENVRIQLLVYFIPR